MKSTFELDLMSPEKPLGKMNVSSVKIEAWNGQMGVLPGHCDAVIRLVPGVVEIQLAETQEPVMYYLGGGVLEFVGGKAVLLCELVESVAEVNHERAEKAEQRALGRLAAASTADVDIIRAQRALKRARARQKLARL